MTNYEKYFGSSEKAAESLARIAKSCYDADDNAITCNECPLRLVLCNKPSAVARWLKEEWNG